MDHAVYLDWKAKELEKLMDGSKTMIIRGATGRKIPYGKVFPNDQLYFINNNGEGLVRAKAIVKEAYHSDKMDKETSIKLVEENQHKLRLTDKQFQKWAGKRYLVLIELEDFTTVESFEIDKREFGNMDDWLPVEKIEYIRK